MAVTALECTPLSLSFPSSVLFGALQAATVPADTAQTRPWGPHTLHWLQWSQCTQSPHPPPRPRWLPGDRTHGPLPPEPHWYSGDRGSGGQCPQPNLPGCPAGGRVFGREARK